MKIGLFDSGSGGLSVLHEAFHMLPDEEFIFYADTDHVPYGIKKPEEIIEFTTEIIGFLIEQGAEVVIIACNTATSVAVEKVRKLYHIPIIGMEPAVKPAVSNRHSKRVMVMATPVTIRENKLKSLIDKVDTDHICDLLPMPRLVKFAENEMFDDPDVYEYLEEQFSSYDLSKYSELVLGCTHFNYFKPCYRKFFEPDTEFIDGNKGTIKNLASKMGLAISSEERRVYFESVDDMMKKTNCTYYASGRKVTDEKALGRIMRLHNRLEDVREY